MMYSGDYSPSLHTNNNTKARVCKILLWTVEILTVPDLVTQNVALPKSVVEIHQQTNGTTRSSLTMPYNNVWRWLTSRDSGTLSLSQHGSIWSLWITKRAKPKRTRANDLRIIQQLLLFAQFAISDYQTNTKSTCHQFYFQVCHHQFHCQYYLLSLVIPFILHV